MKTPALLVCLCGVLWCGDALKCGPHSSFKFTLTSRRNQTGHWIAKVQLDHGAYKDDEAAWEVDIEHTATKCEDSDSVIIVATVAVPPKGTVVVRPETKKPPAGYTEFPGTVYFKAYTDVKRWVEARDICEQDGAHLAVVNSDAEAKFIASLWNTNSDWAYIGTHDLYFEGTYLTIYNETLDKAGYNKWSVGEPNGGIDENCGLINRNTLLGNYFCNLPLPFICEFNG